MRFVITLHTFVIASASDSRRFKTLTKAVFSSHSVTSKFARTYRGYVRGKDDTIARLEGETLAAARAFIVY